MRRGIFWKQSGTRGVVAALITCSSSLRTNLQSCHASMLSSNLSLLLLPPLLLEHEVDDAVPGGGGNLTAAYSPSTLTTRPIGTDRTSSTKITSFNSHCSSSFFESGSSFGAIRLGRL
uniref:Putative secreted protein n=1 Tax=Anopheles darlingi TaxID=43151 RepID=A0A2M4DJ54_ANODA